MDKQNTFGERLESLRNGLTQKGFANKIGIPLNSYTNWVRGIREPSMSAILSICTQLGISSDWLLGLPTAGGGPSVNAGSGAAVNIGSGSATAGGDCSKCQLMADHIRQITGRG